MGIESVQYLFAWKKGRENIYKTQTCTAIVLEQLEKERMRDIDIKTSRFGQGEFRPTSCCIICNCC